MSRIFSPAIAAIVVQLAAVTLITVVFYFLGQEAERPDRDWTVFICEAGPSCHSATLLVRLSYLLTAFGAGLTHNRLVARTARWVRHLTHVARLEKNRFLAKAAAVQLGIAMIAFVVEELDVPSAPVFAIGYWIGSGWVDAIIWPALWSLGIAGLGAMLQALFRAIT